MNSVVAGINSQVSSSRDGLLESTRVQRTKTGIELRAKSRLWAQVHEQCRRMISRLDVNELLSKGKYDT